VYTPQCARRTKGLLNNHHANDNILLRSVPSAISRTQLKMSMDGGELTSALARLDRKWELTSRSSKRPTGGKAGWTKLILDPPDDSEENSTPIDNEVTAAMQEEEFVYLLEPPSTPSLVILFLGGAGLGTCKNILLLSESGINRINQQSF
jgi:hypothetical protein